MGLSSSAGPVDLGAVKLDEAIKLEPAVGQDVDPLALEVGGGVDDADVAALDEVVGHEQVLAVRADLDVVRADDALVRVRVVQALDVVEVGDVERGDVVGGCEGDWRSGGLVWGCEKGRKKREGSSQ